MKRAIFAALCALLVVMAVAIDHPPSTSREEVTIDTVPAVHLSPSTTVDISSDVQVREPTTTTTTPPPPPTTTTAPPPPPPPPPAPTTSAPQYVASGSLDEIIQRYFGAEAPTARRIAQCESGMNPNAVSPTNDHGLFQINIVHRDAFTSVTGAPWSSVYDPELNTKYAHHLWSQQGWSPWTCAR